MVHFIKVPGLFFNVYESNLNNVTLFNVKVTFKPESTADSLRSFVASVFGCAKTVVPISIFRNNWIAKDIESNYKFEGIEIIDGIECAKDHSHYRSCKVTFSPIC